MGTLPVNCNRCGSPADIGPDTRHVTCSHCRTPLVVVRTASSVFTVVAARQKELERIDREWAAEKDQHHAYTDKGGNRCTWDMMLEPVIGLSVLGGFVLLAIIIFAIKDKRFDFILPSLLLLAVMGSLLTCTVVRTRRYWRAETRYRERRSAVEWLLWNEPVLKRRRE